MKLEKALNRIHQLTFPNFLLNAIKMNETNLITPLFNILRCFGNFNFGLINKGRKAVDCDYQNVLKFCAIEDDQIQNCESIKLV